MWNVGSKSLYMRCVRFHFTHFHVISSLWKCTPKSVHLSIWVWFLAWSCLVGHWKRIPTSVSMYFLDIRVILLLVGFLKRQKRQKKKLASIVDSAPPPCHKRYLYLYRLNFQSNPRYSCSGCVHFRVTLRYTYLLATELGSLHDLLGQLISSPC